MAPEALKIGSVGQQRTHAAPVRPRAFPNNGTALDASHAYHIILILPLVASGPCFACSGRGGL